MNAIKTTGQRGSIDAPILEPDLYRSFGHVNILGDPLPYGGRWGGVLVEFEFEGG